jgi:hypothetical protein
MRGLPVIRKDLVNISYCYDHYLDTCFFEGFSVFQVFNLGHVGSSKMENMICTLSKTPNRHHSSIPAFFLPQKSFLT